MTTSREREQILNEYGAWVEQKTLDGLDLSVEAYLEEKESEEHAAKAELIEAMLKGTRANDAAGFLKRARDLFGIESEAPNELD